MPMSCPCFLQQDMSIMMASSTRGALLILRSYAAAAAIVPSHPRKFVISHKPTRLFARNFASRAAGGLPSPDIPRLAQTARISLTQQEVEEVDPKIQQVIEWFEQLQAVDLESVEPAIRAERRGKSAQ